VALVGEAPGGAGVTINPGIAQAPHAAVTGTDQAEPESFALSPSLIMQSASEGGAAEAIRALRTHLMAQHVHEGRRALAVCATSAGSGCTFIAANLALALAQIGIKTLLIDADLRNPSLDALFRFPRPLAGLAQCLADDGSFSEHIQTDVQPGLAVMFSGGRSSNPQELLAGDRFRSLMDFCLREFEVTIVDTPPANICSDARRVSTVTGYGLIVTKRNFTYVDDVKTLLAQLEADRSRVVGTVLNEG
jgi:capsular exopolysaccharide synthesis family protein